MLDNVLSGYLNIKYEVKFCMKKIQKSSAYSVKSIKIDCLPLGCQLGSSEGCGRAGRAFFEGISVTKYENIRSSHHIL